jgi:nitrite reductase/ring-hydroxylating ferredoxin subunit
VVDDTRYVARSYEHGQQVSEIWTTLGALGDHTRVEVEFYFPDIEAALIESLGCAIVTLYTRLWDEDEDMMRQRHARLTEHRDSACEVELGSKTVLLERLEAGATVHFQLRRREYQLRAIAGELVAHSSICPHLLGPLTDVDLSSGTVRCPWHGYEFDLTSGECIFPPQARCVLAPAPALVNVAGTIIACSSE